MISKSEYAQSVAFNGTDSRLKVFEGSNLPEVHDGFYYPKNNISDAVPREKKAGPFGSGTKRFDFPDHVYRGEGDDSAKDPFKDVSDGPVQFGGRNVPRQQISWTGGKARMVNNSLIGAKKPSSSFSKSAERFAAEKIADMGPPPGAYNVEPSWKANGALPMKTTQVDIRKKIDVTSPGPGDYVLPSTMKIPRNNPKNIMISTGKRFEPEYRIPVGPSPMDYDPIPLYGNMIRPTHNIMLAAEYK
jgi:hypothetical protein